MMEHYEERVKRVEIPDELRRRVEEIARRFGQISNRAELFEEFIETLLKKQKRNVLYDRILI